MQAIQLNYPLPRPEFRGEHFVTSHVVTANKESLLLDNSGKLWKVSDNQNIFTDYSGQLRFYAMFGPEFQAGSLRGRVSFCATLNNGIVEEIVVEEVVRPYID